VRANPRYSLVALASLSEPELARVRDLGVDADAHALLYPDAASGLTLKAVGRDTADLFERLPHAAVPENSDAADVSAALVRLILDGVLEIERDGCFVGGALARELVCEAARSPDCSSEIGRLSEAALRYGEALRLRDPLALSVRLYCYNRRPLTREWRRTLGSSDAVRLHLGLDRGGVAARLRDAWVERPPDPSNDGWFHWEAIVSEDPRPARWKLYVSPAPEHIREVLGVVVAETADAGACALKVGKDVAGILRPDKLVAYFPSLTQLRTAAARLSEAVSGVDAQGVPFSAALDPAGLLSYGVDPPVAPHLRGWAGKESWRLWITNRLASALVGAAVTGAEQDGGGYARARLALEGIDTVKWLPSDEQGIWAT
jgi:hypothetical protein